MTPGAIVRPSQPSVQLTPLRSADFAEVEAVAKSIWREHYTSIISQAQIEHMLAGKYTIDDLAPFVDASDCWFDVLRVDGRVRGFLRCASSGADELKLGEIYLHKAQRGTGLGRFLLDRAETLASGLSCRSIILYVNRANTGAIRAYERAGYRVVRECDFDIGNGYFMRDYLMRKSLPVESSG